jgi:hypothetical protein
LHLSGQDAASTSSTHAQLRKNIQEREALSRLKSKLEEQKIQVSAVAVRPVDRNPPDSSSKDSTDQRDVGIISTLTVGCVKLPTRKSTIVTATPPKRILPKMAPAVAGECVPPAMSNHAVVASAAGPGTNNSAAHYVLLSPNPTHAQHQMFIIPPQVHQVDKPSAIPAPPNVGAISLVSQSPIVSQLPATTSVHQSAAKPIILSPLVSADALRAAAASIPFVDASSNTIRSISFVDSGSGEVGPSRVDTHAAVAVCAAESSRLFGTNITSLSRHQSGPAAEMVLDEVASRSRAAVGIGRGAVVDVRELKAGATGAGEVIASEAYGNVSSFIDALVNQGCLGAAETRSATSEMLTVAGASATSNSNQALPLFSSSVVAIPVCSTASGELVGGQGAADWLRSCERR